MPDQEAQRFAIRQGASPGSRSVKTRNQAPELRAAEMAGSKRMAQVALLLNADNPSSKLELQAMKTAEKSLKAELQAFELRARQEFDSTFSAMAKRRIDAIPVHY